MKYTGSCHCGSIAFEVEGTIESVLECNCSICRKRGHLLWFVPRSALKLTKTIVNLGTYRFNKQVIAHHYCVVCGVGPFGEGSDPKGNAMAAVNVRCLDGVDLKALKVVEHDGLSL